MLINFKVGKYETEVEVNFIPGQKQTFHQEGIDDYVEVLDPNLYWIEDDYQEELFEAVRDQITSNREEKEIDDYLWGLWNM